MSSRTTSGRNRAAASTACSPSCAMWTSWPCISRSVARLAAESRLSSTTRMRHGAVRLPVDEAAPPGALQLDAPPGRRELARVVQQVADDLGEPGGIGVQVDRPVRKLGRQLVPHARAEGPIRLGGMVDHGAELDRLPAQLQEEHEVLERGLPHGPAEGFQGPCRPRRLQEYLRGAGEHRFLGRAARSRQALRHPFPGARDGAPARRPAARGGLSAGPPARSSPAGTAVHGHTRQVLGVADAHLLSHGSIIPCAPS
jgi:hypothetical protein